MKRYLAISLFFIGHLGFSQNLDFDMLEFKGLKFISTKSEITKVLGLPIDKYEPNYECGFLSSDEQGVPFYTMDYGKIKFTGSNSENYLIDEINFEGDSSIVLQYGAFELNCETDAQKLIEIFGEKYRAHLTKEYTGGILILGTQHDDGIRLELKNGKLSRFEYWSPC